MFLRAKIHRFWAIGISIASDFELSRILSGLCGSSQWIASYTAAETPAISAFAVSYSMFLVRTQIT